MAKDVKFRLNRRAFQSQILMGQGVDMAGALQSALGPGDDVQIEVSSNARQGGRMRARVYGSLSDEAARGSLSRRLS